MRFLYFVLLPILLVIYALLNFYVGLRTWQFIGRAVLLPSWVYWLVFWLISFSYFGGRILQGLAPDLLSRSCSIIGSYWLGILFYLVLILPVIDLIRLADWRLHFLPAGMNGTAVGLAILLLIAGLMVYGTWNAGHPRIVHYNLKIDKKAGHLDRLHVVMVSDLHLGVIVNKNRLDHMVETINGLKPDIVLIPGDIVDESIMKLDERGIIAPLSQLHARYGVYAAPGNHEYINGDLTAITQYLARSGVHLLRDKYILVAHSFYVVGRDERMNRHASSQRREDLSSLLEGVDRSLPILLMDHEPSDLEEPDHQQIDLQLSGHTHRGQIFPNQYITSLIFEDDYGYLKKRYLQVIVSSGFGTWGPPIRIGNHPEIVDIYINFDRPPSSE
jgi:predicted MPP superfamily phosphohydrolase